MQPTEITYLSGLSGNLPETSRYRRTDLGDEGDFGCPRRHAIIGTFALDGPTSCSGLPVARYDAALLSERLGSGYRLNPIAEPRTPHAVGQRPAVPFRALSEGLTGVGRSSICGRVGPLRLRVANGFGPR